MGLDLQISKKPIPAVWDMLKRERPFCCYIEKNQNFKGVLALFANQSDQTLLPKSQTHYWKEEIFRLFHLSSLDHDDNGTTSFLGHFVLWHYSEENSLLYIQT